MHVCHLHSSGMDLCMMRRAILACSLAQMLIMYVESTDLHWLPSGLRSCMSAEVDSHAVATLSAGRSCHLPATAPAKTLDVIHKAEQSDRMIITSL